MKEFVLSFDLPRSANTPRVRIFRELRKMNAELVNDSFWKSNDLSKLVELATFIKKSGGSATILEEKLIF